MAKPLTSELLREAAGRLRGHDEDGHSIYFMCHAYKDAGGDAEELMLLLGEAVGVGGWDALPMAGLLYFEPAALAWRFDLFNILAEYLDAEQSELATPRGSA